MNVLHRGIWFFVAAVLLAGCTPPWSAFEAEDPLAIRATSSGEVETLLVPCSSVRITRFEVIAAEGTVQNADVPRVWQVDFSPPATDLRRVVLGELPTGGIEQAPWPPVGLDGQDKPYVVQVQLDGGDYWIQGFHQRDLAGGRILFHNKLVSPEIFAEQSRCPRPTGPDR